MAMGGKEMHGLIFPVPDVGLLCTHLEMCSFQLFPKITLGLSTRLY